MFSLPCFEAITIYVILTLVWFQFYFVQNSERCKCESNKTALYGHTNTLTIYMLHDSDLQTVVVSDVQLITIESGYKGLSFICKSLIKTVSLVHQQDDVSGADDSVVSSKWAWTEVPFYCSWVDPYLMLHKQDKGAIWSWAIVISNFYCVCTVVSITHCLQNDSFALNLPYWYREEYNWSTIIQWWDSKTIPYMKWSILPMSCGGLRVQKNHLIHGVGVLPVPCWFWLIALQLKKKKQLSCH